MDWLDQVLLGNPIRSWMVALALSALVILVAKVGRRGLVRRLTVSAPVSAPAWDDALLSVLGSTRSIFVYLLALYTASEVLTIPDRLGTLIARVTFVALLIQIALWGTALIRFFVNRDARANAPQDGARAQSMRAIGFLLTLVLYVIVLLWGLDNFGVNITTLVAGLGVGGIAVALAVQNILGDLFASLTIVLDKPFVYGDFIVVGEFQGTIEHVGLKTTRVRSLSGEQLIFPNADLLQSRIRNFKRMRERRVLFRIGVPYETSIDLLRTIPADIKQIITASENTRFDRAHLVQFGTSSLDFEIVYWVLTADYNTYADLHQAIQLEILRTFAAKGIEFAYPTQTVFSKAGPQAMDPR